ncbi:class I SAM-dependent methyltransferase [Elstera cyanobacteriorum]|uniref:Methyltransferase domain-containing protein n=1 Tax=Elstera cyanobacteriorum TaxID=2022747 RepID=A0A255XLI0_9PROT|nr:class I SAM-dependent methyltransferase [Elstera cyanobacteriorum]MCK6441523.1 class I SAM-dependent methyltransferase [Elstera cyanobacteriorum]OYQ17816.1 hypothetical protein CHR90_12620 [Elstera cyanobacteriorum]GFZ85853.1 ubiquinone/menaquinone biosynthesis methyltransferase [Elstera cyanobacteriorum]
MTFSARDPAPIFADVVDAAWGDPATWTAEGQHWTHLAQVQQTINRRVTGDANLPALTWFFQRVARDRPLPLGRVLIVGCGSAGIENSIVQSGWAAEAVGLDLSPRALALAAEQAAAAGLRGVKHQVADMNALPVGSADLQPGSFDAVFGIAGVHHCANLEGLYSAVSHLLKPGGWFYLDEFIGPSRFQWPDVQTGLISGFLSALPDDLVRTGAGHLRRGYIRPTVQQVIAVDPSEAVRSAEIVPLLPTWFTVEGLFGYGGNLLHLALAQIAQHFHTDAGGHLARLIALEDWCLSEGLLTDDFAVILARKPA